MKILSKWLVIAWVLAMSNPVIAQTKSEDCKPAISSSTGNDLSGQQSSWTSKDLAYFLAPFISLIGVFAIVYWTRKNVTAEHWLKTNGAEIALLQNKLDQFYGPYRLISNANKLIADDVCSRQQDPQNYRLLVKLFDVQWRAGLSPGDAGLVEEICNNGERLRAMVEDNAGLVDQQILPYLARAMAHFRILWMAHDKKLGDDAAPYDHYVYPRGLDEVIRLEVDRLQRRLRVLRAAPNQQHPAIEALSVDEFPLEGWPEPQRG